MCHVSEMTSETRCRAGDTLQVAGSSGSLDGIRCSAHHPVESIIAVALGKKGENTQHFRAHLEVSVVHDSSGRPGVGASKQVASFLCARDFRVRK